MAMGPDKPVRPPVGAPKVKWAAYYEELVQFLLRMLPTELAKYGLDVGSHELHHLPPTDIKKNDKPAIGGTKLTTFREVWNVERCEMAMKTVGKYEAAGVLWWFALATGKVFFQNAEVFVDDVDPSAVEAASVLWDDDAFRASDLTEHRRHYVFPGIYPTACTGLPDVRQTLAPGAGDLGEKVPTFKGLPLIAGRSVMLAYFEALNAAIGAQDGERLKKLFEAMGFHFAN
jgi:hypothetical protein